METDNVAQAERSRFSLLTEFFLLSLVSLFVELLVIRWMGAEIRAFSVFKSFPLVICFIGLGVGFSLPKDKSFRMALPAMLVFAASMKLVEVVHANDLSFPSFSVFNWTTELPNQFGHVWLNLFALMVLVVFLLMGPFGMLVAIGSRLGQLFNRFEPLPAYCWNIGGAIAGSVLFSILSFLGWSPGMAICLPAAVLLFYLPKPWKLVDLFIPVSAVAAIALACSINPITPIAQTYWSPYQRIDMVPERFIIEGGNQRHIYDFAYQLCANRMGYQQYTDWHVMDQLKKDGFALPKDMEEKVYANARRCEMPFKLRRPLGDVLIVGSGMGADVMYALRNGARSIDAVEIDPVILRLGKVQNPAQPYAAPNVHAYCNDARNFFRTTQKKYDLIDFSHLDSHITTTGSSVRIDNFVYTVQSFRQALQLLKPDGIMVVSYYSYRHWFDHRLRNTITEAVGYKPLVLTDDGGSISFVVGQSVKGGAFSVTPEFLREVGHSVDTAKPGPSRILTDDWPYLYVTPGVIDLPYLLVVAELVAIFLVAGFKTIRYVTEPSRWQMFFLGAGFLLIELQSIARLSLVYGSTWITSAVVINGVLLMILAANLVLLRTADFVYRYVRLVYCLLFLALAVSYFLPLSLLNSSSSDWLVTIITLLPVLFASLIFSSCFARVKTPSHALAYNLCGSFVGGLLEYLSNYTGINALVLIAAALYAMSFIALIQAQIKKQEPEPATQAS